MHYLLTFAGEDPPAGYTKPIPCPPERGVDWFIQGYAHPFREVSRVDTENGYTLTLKRADSALLYALLNGDSVV